MSLENYQQIEAVVAQGRALEERALTACARRLDEAVVSNDSEVLVKAVMQNSKLWLFFYSEIESGNVQLPPEIARNIITLAAYVAKVSPRAYAGENEVLKTLISINRNIAAGLSEAASNDSEEQVVVPQSNASAGLSVVT
jgi:flagellar biosynthesis regulator FlaF